LYSRVTRRNFDRLAAGTLDLHEAFRLPKLALPVDVRHSGGVVSFLQVKTALLVAELPKQGTFLHQDERDALKDLLNRHGPDDAFVAPRTADYGRAVAVNGSASEWTTGKAVANEHTLAAACWSH
jgi:hypothetical protein